MFFIKIIYNYRRNDGRIKLRLFQNFHSKNNSYNLKNEQRQQNVTRWRLLVGLHAYKTCGSSVCSRRKLLCRNKITFIAFVQLIFPLQLYGCLLDLLSSQTDPQTNIPQVEE